MFRLLILHANDDIWHRFYDTTINLRVYKSPQYISISNGKHYIKNVLFKNFRSDGAIRLVTPFDFPFDKYRDLDIIELFRIREEYEKAHEEMLKKRYDKMLIVNSFFLNCYSDGNGGSIYINKGSCIQYRVCSINSKCHYYGGHSAVYAVYENYVIESSIMNSHAWWGGVDINEGHQFIGSTNITHAKCEEASGFQCLYPLTHHINFTSVINCTSDKKSLIYQIDNDQYVSHCNFVNNTYLEKDYGGLVNSHTCYYLEYSLCVFASNSASCLFYHHHSPYANTFVVKQCFIHDNDIIVPAAGDPVILNTTDSLVIDLHKLPIQKCNLLEVQQSSSYNAYQDPDKLKMKPI